MGGVSEILSFRILGMAFNEEPVVGASAANDDDSPYLIGRLPAGTCENLRRTFAQGVGLFLIIVLTSDVGVLVCWCVH